MNQSNIETSTQLEENMGFTLYDHHKERIKHHMKMLNYYLKEQKNDRLGT